MSLIILNVPAISCGHCARTISTVLGALEGVEKVAVDIRSKQVQVEYEEPFTNIEQMKTVLAEAGYPVALDEEPITVIAMGSGCACCAG